MIVRRATVDDHRTWAAMLAKLHRPFGAVEDWARAQGLNWIGSDTEPDNARSRAFHKALGFDEVEKLVIFGKSLD